MAIRKQPSARPDLTPAPPLERKATPGLEHGAPSLVAMENPDDSQLGARPRQGKEQGE